MLPKLKTRVAAETKQTQYSTNWTKFTSVYLKTDLESQTTCETKRIGKVCFVFGTRGKDKV